MPTNTLQYYDPIAHTYQGQPVASWVIVDRSTRAVIFETFSASVAAKVNTAKYEVLPILAYLQAFNQAVQS